MNEITPQWMIDQGFSITFAERFWSKVVRTDGCWLWTASTDRDRYGHIKKGAHKSKLIIAHRASWILHFGPIADGQNVPHTCDNPPCTRPDHLFLGTRRDNFIDSLTKGRHVFLSKAKLSIADVDRIREL